MVNATSLGNNTDDHVEQLTPPDVPTVYPCNSCQVSFQDGQEQRIHMKEPWHVNNIKRRLASLPPLPRNAFDTNIVKKPAVRKTATINRYSGSNDDEDGSSHDDDQRTSPFQCLFCSQTFAEDDDDGMAMNLEHMQTVHGMSIPDVEMVTNMESFLEYLATEVRTWHECLYCGATKSSVRSIQSHMRDKGHCLLNLDREPELLEFWESPRAAEGDDAVATPEHERPLRMSETEMQFVSGKVISSRHAAPVSKRAPRTQSLDLVPSATKASSPDPEDAETRQLKARPQLPSAQQLARREDMSLQGFSAQQQQALVLAVKKAQRSEAVARRAREWVNAKGANLQKYDQIDTTGKRGKQNHKLQPR